MSRTLAHRNLRGGWYRWTVAIALPVVVALGLGRATTGLAYAQTYEGIVVHEFTGKADGGHPTDPLIMDANGNLYGTASTGGDLKCGAKDGCGVVFEVDAGGNYSVLHTFDGIDGFDPTAGLFMDAEGNLYGTTKTTVFKVSSRHQASTLWRFAKGQEPQGQAGVIMDAKGNLYGTTSTSRAYGYGTVYKLDPATRKFTVLHNFPGGKDGITLTGVTMDGHGNLFGATHGGLSCKDGGKNECGVVFKMTADSDGSWAESILLSFDGTFPDSNLTLDAEGNVYGTTYGGGSRCKDGGCGTVFKLSRTGKETLLHGFTGGRDGLHPYGPLFRDSKGDLYGTTAQGGATGGGTVFKLDPHGGLTPLWDFVPGKQMGSEPLGSVIIDAQGDLFGTTYLGGNASCSCGTVFELKNEE